MTLLMQSTKCRGMWWHRAQGSMISFWLRPLEFIESTTVVLGEHYRVFSVAGKTVGVFSGNSSSSG